MVPGSLLGLQISSGLLVRRDFLGIQVCIRNSLVDNCNQLKLAQFYCSIDGDRAFPDENFVASRFIATEACIIESSNNCS
jgi:hypothetical protein